MAACGYLLLLTCILAHLPLVRFISELARLPEGRILHEDNTHRQHSQISMVGRRSEPPPRLHGGHPRKVPSFPEAEQQKNKPLQFRRRQRSSNKLFPVGEELEVVEDAMTGHKEYYLPRPPSRMNSRVYPDLEDEKLRQAHKHHNDREHKHEHRHKYKHEHGPIIERNNYWILGQKRFRMIVIIILAVIVCLIILLMLVWFIHPRKNVRKTSSKK
ncbi:uncharacterized protein LOC144668998 isoform X6 [Cetorhinus maximus]